MSAPDGFLTSAATGAAPGTASTVVPARSGPSTLATPCPEISWEQQATRRSFAACRTREPVRRVDFLGHRHEGACPKEAYLLGPHRITPDLLISSWSPAAPRRSRANAVSAVRKTVTCDKSVVQKGHFCTNTLDALQ